MNNRQRKRFYHRRLWHFTCGSVGLPCVQWSFSAQAWGKGQGKKGRTVNGETFI